MLRDTFFVDTRTVKLQYVLTMWQFANPNLESRLQ